MEMNGWCHAQTAAEEFSRFHRLLKTDHEIKHWKVYYQNGHNKMYFNMKCEWHRIYFET
jgi:hypothetical protein